MSTTGNSDVTVAPPESSAEETAHADLVAKLVGEAYSELTRLTRQPATPVSTLPEPPIPAGLPELGATNTSSAMPPVHPSSQPAAPKLAEPEKTPTGAHTPDSSDSYAFGEPRCNGSYQLQSRQPETKTANPNPLLGLPQAESLAAPEYYFLRGSQASGKSPLAETSYPANEPPVPRFDIEGVRRDFPALHQLVHGQPLIWFDNAATTHKPQAVIDATAQFYSRQLQHSSRRPHARRARD